LLPEQPEQHLLVATMILLSFEVLSTSLGSIHRMQKAGEGFAGVPPEIKIVSDGMYVRHGGFSG